MRLTIDSKNTLQDIAMNAVGKSRIVFVSGNFNIVHPGHLRLLRFAAECGDYLVVGVNDRNSPGALLEELLRLDSVQSIGLVDYAFILRDHPEDFIATLKPAVVVKGKEYEDRYNAEKEAINSYGGKLLFSSGDVGFSSIDLLHKEFQQLNLSTIIPPKDFPARHGFSITDIEQAIERMKGLRVCVLGDTIVDEYITCNPLGMSQEDPTIVVTPVLSERFIGGAAIVAAHARGLGASVKFYSVVGHDDVAEYVRDQLGIYGVEHHLYDDESRPTTLKQRYRANGKTLLRVSHLRNQHISSDLRKKILSDILFGIANTDLVIFSDFSYGCLPQSLVDEICDYCARHKIMLVADSQSSSQVGDISRFKNATLVTPTEREARLALRDFDSGLVVVAQLLREKLKAANVIITLGSEGLLIHAPVLDKEEWHTDRLPSFNTAPKDISGAGDSLLTCSSMAMAVGCNIWMSAYLGSLAAACQVGRIGNIPLRPSDLRSEINPS